MATPLFFSMVLVLGIALGKLTIAMVDGILLFFLGLFGSSPICVSVTSQSKNETSETTSSFKIVIRDRNILYVLGSSQWPRLDSVLSYKAYWVSRLFIYHQHDNFHLPHNVTRPSPTTPEY